MSGLGQAGRLCVGHLAGGWRRQLDCNDCGRTYQQAGCPRPSSCYFGRSSASCCSLKEPISVKSIYGYQFVCIQTVICDFEEKNVKKRRRSLSLFVDQARDPLDSSLATFVRSGHRALALYRTTGHRSGYDVLVHGLLPLHDLLELCPHLPEGLDVDEVICLPLGLVAVCLPLLELAKHRSLYVCQPAIKWVDLDQCKVR